MLSVKNLTKEFVIGELAKKYNLDFLNNLLSVPGAEVYVFGGALRDMVLEDQWKEADIRMIVPVSLSERERLLDEALASITIQEKVMIESIDLAIYRFLPVGSTTDCSIDLSVAPNIETNISDFTINSLYFNLGTGELFDRFGGVKDIESRVLRVCTPERATEIFRAVKAVCKHDLTIENATLELLKQNLAAAKNVLEYVSVNKTGLLTELYQSDIFRGLKYDAYKYYQLFESLGLLDEVIKFLTETGDSAERPANPFKRSEVFDFESAISIFLSTLARGLCAANPEEKFLKIKTKLSLDKRPEYTDFVVDNDKIIFV